MGGEGNESLWRRIMPSLPLKSVLISEEYYWSVYFSRIGKGG